MVRLAYERDLPSIFQIYEDARQYMKLNGNPYQWGNSDPSEKVIQKDLKEERLYVLERDGRLEGVFALLKDGDPCYDHIEGKGWISDGPYVAVHRVAAAKGCCGIMRQVMDYVKAIGENIRMDTHRDNLTMQHILAREGFSCRGVIRVTDGTERIAFELILK